MASGTVNTTVAVAGLSIRGAATVTDETQIGTDGTLSAAKAGTLSTRTDNDTGVVTLTAGHGLSSGTYDVHWTASGLMYSRRGMTGTLSTNDMSLDGGTGTNLPAQSTSVTICLQSTFDCDFAGDNLKLLALSATQPAVFDLQENGGTSHLAVHVAAGDVYLWKNDGNWTNPVAGDTIGRIVCSSAGTTAATVNIGAVLTSQS